MADFNKIGLLIFSTDRTKFLVCVKDNFTSDYILPGGRIEAGEDDATCLQREIREELDVDLNMQGLQYFGTYHDVAAGDHTKSISLKLYEGAITGTPKPSSEIIELHWLGKTDASHPHLSPILKHFVFPDLIVKNILR